MENLNSELKKVAGAFVARNVWDEGKYGYYYSDTSKTRGKESLHRSYIRVTVSTFTCEEVKSRPEANDPNYRYYSIKELIAVTGIVGNMIVDN